MNGGPAVLQAAKQVVLDFHADLDETLLTRTDPGPGLALSRHVAAGYLWRGMHPFYQQRGASEVADTFWEPLRRSFAPLQRRPDIFFAGHNDVAADSTIWVCEMGNFLGLFDEPWLGIVPTRKMMSLRYAEFNRIDEEGKIAETALFWDVVSIMEQAGISPFPVTTGQFFRYPGPRTHDGLLYGENEPAEGAKTMALVNRMVQDIIDEYEIAATQGVDLCSPETLAKTWHDDMIWYGPAGIGASYTIDRYQEQHQIPFRRQLTDKAFHGHVARFAEGNYAGFFGWANISNRNAGGFLGMPASDTAAEMRVVDIYRRHGDKLAENWIFIDLLHWLSMQGIDVLGHAPETAPGATRDA